MVPETAEQTAQFIFRFASGEGLERPSPPSALNGPAPERVMPEAAAGRFSAMIPVYVP